MSDCPRCQQALDAQAITCPHCGLVLKAYGHPGIPLYRAHGGTYLCQTCVYHEDDTCNFPQRPFAKECTLYTDIAKHQSDARAIRYRGGTPQQRVQTWLKRHTLWLVLGGLLVLSLLLSL